MPSLEFCLVPQSVKDDQRRRTSTFTADRTIDHTLSETFINNRRKSFDINDDPLAVTPFPQKNTELSCVNRFCSIF